MFSHNGYTAHYLGPKRGTLVATPQGKLYHMTEAGKVTERTVGTIESLAKVLTDKVVARGEWRDLPVTDGLRKQFAIYKLVCPSTRGKAIDYLSYHLAVSAVKRAEQSQQAAAVKVVEKPVEPVVKQKPTGKAKPVEVELSDEPTIEELAAYLKAHPDVNIRAAA